MRGGEADEAISTTYIGSLYEVEGSVAAGFSLRKHIFMGSNRIATISLSQGGEGQGEGAIYYYHSDHLGSSNLITDSTGNQVGLTEFTPYGSVIKQTGTYDPKYKFTGKELDNTGLYFYGARYYDPEIGRFVTADPTIQRPYDPQDLNRYSYCRNNPLNLVDPSGLGWFSKLWKKVVNFFKKEVLPPLISAVVSATVAVLTGQAWAVVFISSASAATATAALDTGEGRKLVRNVANEFFDDALGLRPKAAYVSSYLTLNMALTWTLERAGAKIFLKNGTVDYNVKQTDMDELGKTNFPATNVEEVYDKNMGLVGKVIGGKDTFYFAHEPFVKNSFGNLPVIKNIIPEHVASSHATWNSFFDKITHGTLGGACMNRANAAAAGRGYSWAASSTSSNVWTYTAEMTYGVYGNLLPVRVLNYENARSKYEKR